MNATQETLAVKDQTIAELRALVILQQTTIDDQSRELCALRGLCVEKIPSSEQFGALTAGDIDDMIAARPETDDAIQPDAPEADPVLDPAYEDFLARRANAGRLSRSNQTQPIAA